MKKICIILLSMVLLVCSIGLFNAEHEGYGIVLLILSALTAIIGDKKQTKRRMQGALFLQSHAYGNRKSTKSN